MKTTLTNILYATFLIVLIGCNSEKKNNASNNTEDIDVLQTEENISLGDNSQTSLDWDGTYKGVIPCADCEGIEMTVTITQDNTYHIEETYLGKNTTAFESEGTFAWDDTGQKIIFSDTDRHPYFVGENTLTLLDKDGNKITGELESFYVLTKDHSQ